MVDSAFIARTAHEDAVLRLREELRRNRKVGDRLPPIKQLAKALGIGQTNAHRAAQQLAAEGLLVARTRRGTFVARIPQKLSADLDATQPPSPRFRAVLLRLPAHASDQFLQPAVQTLTEQVALAGVAIQTLEVDIRCRMADPQTLAAFDAMITLQPSGFVTLANDTRRPALVLTTSEVEPMAVEAGYDMVSADSQQGSMLAGQWMRRVAPHGVGFIGAAQFRVMNFDAVSVKRLQGFEQGLGRSIAPSNILMADSHRAASGAEIFEKYVAMARRPRGIFCASDDLAVGFLHAAHIHGLRAGEDFHLIGFDGQYRGQTAPDGPLTTVRVPTHAMGRAAADLLLSRLADPTLPVRRVLLGCDFIEGRTARPDNTTSPNH